MIRKCLLLFLLLFYSDRLFLRPLSRRVNHSVPRKENFHRLQKLTPTAAKSSSWITPIGGEVSGWRERGNFTAMTPTLSLFFPTA